MANGHTRNEVNKRLNAIAGLKAEIDWLLKGQTVTIVSKYNGQPYGRSRKPLTGEMRKVKSVHLSEFQGPCIHLFVEGERIGLRMDEVQLKDDVTA